MARGVHALSFGVSDLPPPPPHDSLEASPTTHSPYHIERQARVHSLRPHSYMSFSGTPLGQARRLDRDTFLGKPNSNGNRPPSPHKIIPTSYTVGATVLGTPSPAKPASPTRDTHPDDTTDNEPALARFARQKQREAAGTTRPGAPRTITSPPNPTRWNVKDTTVNIASAFAQAANSTADMVPAFNPNNSWASSSRTATHIPRSTSVEYEAQTSATQGRRLAAPNRFPGRGTSATAQKPPSKSRSLQHVPDSEGEEQGSSGRAKSPFEQIVEAARQALDPAVYYVRQRLGEAEENRSLSIEQQNLTNGSHAGHDSSYNYEEEERYVQREQEKEKERSQRSDRTKAKKGRISVDNQAWKPSRSDGEESEDEGPEKRRKGGKKNLSVSRLTNLPTVVDGKTSKRRRPKGSKGNIGGADDDDGAGSDGYSHTDISASIAGQNDISMPPPPRISVDPPENSGEVSMDFAELGLQSIPEVGEEDLARSSKAAAPEVKLRTRSRRGSRATTPLPRSPPFSIGALLGTLIRYIVTATNGVFVVFVKLLSSFLFLLGRVLGTIYDVLLNRPYLWVSRTTRSGFFTSTGKYVLLGATLLSARYALQNPTISSLLPSLPGSRSSAAITPVYTAPGVPVANIDELVQRLTRMEAALSDLSTDNARIKSKTEDSSKSYGDVLQRLGSVEGRITAEARRISDTESRARETIGRSISTVKQEVEVLHAQLEAQQRQQENEKEREREKEKEKKERPVVVPEVVVKNDEEARARLRALEERVGSVEGGVKDALELGKKLASASLVPAAPVAVPNQGAAWWNKIISKSGNKEGLRITTPDGQDVTGLISHLVDNAMSVVTKDGLAKPDFALHSGGGRVIPSLTSPTLEIKPSTIRGTIFGVLTGNGYAIGHPPVTAIEPSLHAGRCWPIAGESGQLAVALAMPAYIEEITIDHLAREVSFDMRTAPRQMDVWGLVEGKDNIAKLHAFRERKVAARREALEASGQVVDADWEERERERERTEGYPATLPRNPEYVRIAKFTYDIHAPKHVQTFSVDPEVKEMGVDFGVVVARILNNWGHGTYTCLYRLRVHGKRTGELPPPYSESSDSEGAEGEASASL